MDTAGHSGQSADDGGEDAQTTCTEQKVLWRNMRTGNVSPTTVMARVCQISRMMSQLFKSVLKQSPNRNF